MSGKMTKAAYQEVINADIRWVKEQTNQGLLSQHIIAVLEDSIIQHYADEIKAEEIKQIYVGGLNDDFKTVDEAMNWIHGRGGGSVKYVINCSKNTEID